MSQLSTLFALGLASVVAGTGADFNQPQEMSIDRALGCSAEDNVIATLLLGLIAGVFAAILPCMFMCFRAQDIWAKDFLDPSNPSVRRTLAVVREKKVHESYGNDSNRSTSYMAIIEFTPRRNDGTEVPVRATVSVMDSFFNRIAPGSEVEVAYRVGDERDFVIPENFEEQQNAGNRYRGFIYCFLSIFALVGALIGAGILPLTGCFFGLIPFGLLAVSGGVAGRYVFFPMMRALAKSSLYVSTEGKRTPIENMPCEVHNGGVCVNQPGVALGQADVQGFVGSSNAV